MVIANLVATMLALRMMSFVALLALVIQHVGGNKSAVTIVIGNEDFITSGEDDNSLICCVYGNCSCSSLDHALANLTSNVLINITTDVTLSSLVSVSDLENVSIIGHDNPTVNCRSAGGIHFTFCNNCIIQGITWDGCGTETIDHDTEPGLKLSYSSNITIQSCSFQQSVGQAIVLSEMSGDVNINDCTFVNNSCYPGHGAAVHYSSGSATNTPQISFTINYCNFTYNRRAKSLVYIGNKVSKPSINIICNSKFCHNQGVSVYAVEQNIYLRGKILFLNSTAVEYIYRKATGIYISDHSTVIFDKNSEVKFIENSISRAYWQAGGTVLSGSYSSIVFDHNSMTTFHDDNDVAIFSEDNSNVTFKGTCQVEFSSKVDALIDTVTAIQSLQNCHIMFTDNSNVTFQNYRKGRIIRLHGRSQVSFAGNSTTVFLDNLGEAISTYDSDISFKGNSTTIFSNNIAVHYFGVLCVIHYSHLSFEDGSHTLFSANTATSIVNSRPRAGIIYSDSHCHIHFQGHSHTVFENNVVENGAVVSRVDANITFGDDSKVTFINNDAKVGATVFCTIDSKIIVKGNPTVKINDVSAKWCNNTCIPYIDQDVITIDGNGIVWCYNQTAFVCLSEKCHCNKFEDILKGIKGNTVVNLADKVILTDNVLLGRSQCKNMVLIGHDDFTVLCTNTGLTLFFCSNVTFKNIKWIACGAYLKHSRHKNVLSFLTSSDITIQNCTFRHSMSSAVVFDGVSGNVEVSHCNFMNNYKHNDQDSDIKAAAIIHRVRNARLDSVVISDCIFNYNGGTKSVVYLEQYYTEYLLNFHFNNCIFYNNQGVSIYLSGRNFILHINEEVVFQNNTAENGAAIFISDNSTLVFHERSHVKFINNSVDHDGATVFLNNHSSITFEPNSVVTFTDNKATNGTVYSVNNSNVIFKGTSEVTFSSNSATQYGAAIYSSDNSHVTFTGNSTTTFSNNIVFSDDINAQHGGTIFSENNGYISFEEDAITVFSNNTANFGVAIFSLYSSDVTFKERSRIIFNNNVARGCGVLTSSILSNINFNDNTKVIYSNNTVYYVYTFTSSDETSAAAAICTFQGTETIFSGHSTVTFINNTAGAVAFSESSVTMKDHSIIMFKNNFAWFSSGGAFVCYDNSNVTVKDNSNIIFSSNEASQSGGTIHSYGICKITFEGNSTSTFVSNTARNNGGAIFSSQLSELTFKEYSSVIFEHNIADNGGAFYITNSTVTFKETSKTLFNNNKARRNGGIGYLSLHADMIVEGNTTVRFDNNTAEQNAGVLYITNSDILLKGNSAITLTYNTATLNGGVLYFDDKSSVSFSEFTNMTFHHNRALYGGAILANDHCNVTLKGNATILFADNEATQSGGAGYFNFYSNLVLKEDAMVTFNNNKAFRGGAVCVDNRATITCEGNVTALFDYNLAAVSGGAVTVLKDSNFTLKDHVTIILTNNSAQYGGAIFIDRTATMINNSDEECLYFTNNTAKISGNTMHQHVVEFCNNSCLNSRMTNVSIEFIATPPKQLNLNDPAVCIDNDNDTECNNYYVQNIMLGTEITIPTCVLDYYNESVDSTQFLIHSETHSNYFNSGPNEVLISCDNLQGINIIGNQTLSKPINFSINVALNIAINPDWRQVTVNLIIGLLPCHPGFWQYPNSTGCECYNASDIVFCSGSSSTIKRGYWFGSVTGKPTVTFCPINYCNFTCCETSNGYYHLSPVRDYQCRSHRSGTACGSCTDGYTLSFDSPECVDVDSCTAGQTVLVILLTVTYWIVMVTLVFAMMYYKVPIGYLYSITYYYSIVDIILSQNFYASQGLYLTVSIMSSFSKITPQFLGELCLTTGMSGIDQQFIHYIHPSAVLLILIIISLSARSSRRISAFISRGIIHVICLLLLLSYTSIASTSLLLMRSLTFHGIDRIYTYLSPDIEYFYGRHLAYGIAALLCTVTIVLGLPLLLISEPFLNHKINFAKIKPLLDQFQGCYKDKYRCFAGYYMICRLVIITIVIANSSNEFVASYLLIVACGVIALIHVTAKPYNNEIVNKFDGMILQLIIFITALPLLDDFDSPIATSINFVLVLLPLLTFIAITLFLHKDDIKKITKQFAFKDKAPTGNDEDVHNKEVPMKEFDLIVDDSARKKATTTVCDM